MYSEKDNKAGLLAFFNNLAPKTGNYYVYEEEEEFKHHLYKNITSVFGATDSNEDFYTFLKAVFADSIPEVNKFLKGFRYKEIPIEKEEDEEAEKENTATSDSGIKEEKE